MPKTLNTALPRNIKPTAKHKAVSMDWTIILARSLGSTPSVSETKIGSTPIASTATNIEIKDNKIFLAIQELKT
jgi:hypothetical protein